MSEAWRELTGAGVRLLRRSIRWWTVAVSFFVLLNIAFWPSLRDSEALEGFQDAEELMQAFGVEDLATAAGYLDGQVFALMLPALLCGMAITVVTALTSGDEDAGRLELLHALPVSRRQLWLSRFVAATLGVLTVAAAAGVIVAVGLPVFSFDGVSVLRVAQATLGCTWLALFHGAIAFAAGAGGLTRGRAVGAAVVVLVGGYVVSTVLPLAESLEGLRPLSPWYWAIGTQPVSDGIEPGLSAFIVFATIAVVVGGLVALDRRDIRGA